MHPHMLNKELWNCCPFLCLTLTKKVSLRACKPLILISVSGYYVFHVEKGHSITKVCLQQEEEQTECSKLQKWHLRCVDWSMKSTRALNNMQEEQLWAAQCLNYSLLMKLVQMKANKHPFIHHSLFRLCLCDVFANKHYKASLLRPQCAASTMPAGTESLLCCVFNALLACL